MRKEKNVGGSFRFFEAGAELFDDAAAGSFQKQRGKAEQYYAEH